MATEQVYVGNLPFTCTADEVRTMFAPYSEVQACTIEATCTRPGYAFVEMEAAEAEQAVAALSGSMQGGRPLQIRVQTD